MPVVRGVHEAKVRRTGIRHRSYYGYNAWAQRASIQDALGQTRYLSYDACGNNHQAVDALGRASYFDYRCLCQVVSGGRGVSFLSLTKRS